MDVRVPEPRHNDAPASDADLLTRYSTLNDTEAAGALLSRHADAAYGIALRNLRNPADAEDAVQAGFADALRRPDSYLANRETLSVKSWLIRLVLNACREMRRASHRRIQREHIKAEGSRVMNSPAEPQQPEVAAAIRRAIDQLPEHYGTPVWMHYVEGLPAAEVAAVLNRPHSTIRNQLARGVEQLRRMLAQSGYASVAAPALLNLLAASGEAAPVTLRSALAHLPAEVPVAADSASATAHSTPGRPRSGRMGRRRLTVRTAPHALPWVLGAAGFLVLAVVALKPPAPVAPVATAAQASAVVAHTAEPRIFPAEFTVNFGPEGLSLPPGVLNDSGEPYDAQRGYGWIGPKKGKPLPGVFSKMKDGPLQIYEGRGEGARHILKDVLRDTGIAAGWRRHSESWIIDLPNGKYLFSVCCGDAACDQGPHEVVVQGREIVKEVMTAPNEFYEQKDIPVEVTDGRLTMVVGGHDSPKMDGAESSDTIVNFLVIKRVGN